MKICSIILTCTKEQPFALPWFGEKQFLDWYVGSGVQRLDYWFSPVVMVGGFPVVDGLRNNGMMDSLHTS
jgi:hypothetical protein